MGVFQIAIPVLILVLQATILIAELRYGKWRKVSIKTTEINGFGPLYVTRTQIACGLQCSSYPGCYLYCYDNINSACYLKTHTSSGFTLPEVEAVQCYKQRCAFTAGYFPYAGRCIRLFTNQLSFPSARQRCKQDGAHLYHLKTIDDRQPVIDIMRDNGFLTTTSESFFWVGADDLNNDGKFVWSDGDVLPRNSVFWRAGEPNNYLGNEFCVSISNTHVLTDDVCNQLFSYMCQLDF